MDKQDLNQETLPFFARYLEGQINFMEEISEEETQAVVGGGKRMTKKYPSDKEDFSGGKGIAVTEKYPSDCEDSSGGGRMVVTKKAPSDNEDSSGGDQIFVTLKYPSDNEDSSGSVA